MSTGSLAEKIVVTAECMGYDLSPAGAADLVQELAEFDEEQVRGALKACMRVGGRLTLAFIVANIQDGRPGPAEAWAALPWDEARTAVLTEETFEAWGASNAAYAAGDRNAARLAFVERYVKLVAEARLKRVACSWRATLGYDAAGRSGPLMEAVRLGRIGPNHAGQYVGPDDRERLIEAAPKPAPKRIGR